VGLFTGGAVCLRDLRKRELVGSLWACLRMESRESIAKGRRVLSRTKDLADDCTASGKEHKLDLQWAAGSSNESRSTNGRGGWQAANASGLAWVRYNGNFILRLAGFPGSVRAKFSRSCAHGGDGACFGGAATGRYYPVATATRRLSLDRSCWPRPARPAGKVFAENSLVSNTKAAD
jgi:hypothetical protein